MEDGGEAGGQRDEVGWGTPSPRRSPPGSQTHTFPGSQFVCLQKKLFFKACSHLPEENMSFKKKTETKKQNKTNNTNVDRQECVLEKSPLLLPDSGDGTEWQDSLVIHMLY